MTLRELLKTFDENKHTYYANLYALYRNNNGEEAVFLYNGHPEVVTSLLDFLPNTILNKDVIKFGKYSLFNESSYGLSESGKIVYIDFAITIEY